MYMYLSGNRFTGSLLSSLSSPRKVARLRISSNLCQGTIHLEVVARPNLKLLDWSYNFLSESDPTFIGTMSGLTSVVLDGNWVVGEVPSLPYTSYKVYKQSLHDVESFL